MWSITTSQMTQSRFLSAMMPTRGATRTQSLCERARSPKSLEGSTASESAPTMCLTMSTLETLTSRLETLSRYTTASSICTTATNSPETTTATCTAWSSPPSASLLRSSSSIPCRQSLPTLDTALRKTRLHPSTASCPRHRRLMLSSRKSLTASSSGGRQSLTWTRWATRGQTTRSAGSLCPSLWLIRLLRSMSLLCQTAALWEASSLRDRRFASMAQGSMRACI
mmetsp:Transcript_4406/g.10209  ORF Transcript_4406/g.10209 Transcript_4406/m.10209 type:complete len:225 (+) Transcript_4406:971-1645(+)